MKVLTIKEPFATLIKNKVKYIETRSWKTNYRGELYIHSSQKKFGKEILSHIDLINLIKNEEMHYGNIICKCNLVDYIYMDEEFLNKIKNNKQEYICGYYELGRYAWVLEDIQIIKPIPVKGKLNIWNYDINKEEYYDNI